MRVNQRSHGNCESHQLTRSQETDYDRDYLVFGNVFMHGDPRPPLHSSIPRNVLWHVFCRVFDSEVLGLLVRLVPAAEAEVPVVNLPASIEQDRRGDDGHESLRSHDDFVRLWKTTARQTLDHCLAIVKSKSPRLQNPSLRSPSTVPPGQAQNAWGFRQL